jgi:DNA-binding transcriptional ArsR family regulator
MSDASELFGVLAAAHRRRILFLLCEREAVNLPEGLLTRGASADDGNAGGRRSVSASGGETRPGDGSPSSATAREEDLELALVHKHLPKLENRGLVEWDPDERSVSRGPGFEEAEPALRTLAENADAFPGDLY